MAKKKVSVIKPRNAGTMTESAYFSKIRSVLRNGFRYWKPMQLTLDAASRPSQSDNKRLKKEYKCAHCKKWFPRKGVEIDHVEECGSLKNYDDIVPFLKRLTKEKLTDYQILCKPCHLAKTNSNRELNKNKDAV